MFEFPSNYVGLYSSRTSSGLKKTNVGGEGWVGEPKAKVREQNTEGIHVVEDFQVCNSEPLPLTPLVITWDPCLAIGSFLNDLQMVLRALARQFGLPKDLQVLSEFQKSASALKSKFAKAQNPLQIYIGKGICEFSQNHKELFKKLAPEVTLRPHRARKA